MGRVSPDSRSVQGGGGGWRGCRGGGGDRNRNLVTRHIMVSLKIGPSLTGRSSREGKGGVYW